MKQFALLWGMEAWQVLGVQITPQQTTITLSAMAADCRCPQCGIRSTRIHSRQVRTIADLPACGRPMCLRVRVRRFLCVGPDCPQQTFAQPLAGLARRHGRKTCRLAEALTELVFATGGEAGGRLAARLAMPASADTLLRLARRAPLPAAGAVRVLGVDDWAFRRGQHYGTILCDLESGRPVDLLNQRSSEALANWLGQHPEVLWISRDRGMEYARGAGIGAPRAAQIADRFHLWQNLSDALIKALDRRHLLLSDAARSLTRASTPAASCGPLSARAQRKSQRRCRRLGRYEQVKRMADQGLSLRQIAAELKIHRNTVRRLVRAQSFPEPCTPAKRAGPLDPFVDYLQDRWGQGCHAVPQLYRELKSRGFGGSVHMVRRHVAVWRKTSDTPSTPTVPSTPNAPTPSAAPPLSARPWRPSARNVAWLLLQPAKTRSPRQQALLDGLDRRWPQLAENMTLIHQFASVLSGHEPADLEAWVQLAHEPAIEPELQRFADGLRQDWPAVVQAVCQPWSNGPVEGQVNRLKLIKRQMYGRANFDLLRARVLRAN
jgi:transposase